MYENKTQKEKQRKEEKKKTTDWKSGNDQPTEEMAHFWSNMKQCKRTFVTLCKQCISAHKNQCGCEKSNQKPTQNTIHIIVIFLYAFMSLVPFGDKNYTHTYMNACAHTHIFIVSSFKRFFHISFLNLLLRYLLLFIRRSANEISEDIR